MNINRHNYEEYFLLYIDQELKDGERKAVEDFIKENPDLEGEFRMLREMVMHPDRQEVFGNKEILMKPEPVSGTIDESNYEEYFVAYGDNELGTDMQHAVEQFVYSHPRYQSEFELILQARMSPDPLVVFPDKSRLYRKEKEEGAVVIRWWRIAAAAAVILLLAGFAWMIVGKNETVNPIAGKQGNNQPANTSPIPANKQEPEQQLANVLKEKTAPNEINYPNPGNPNTNSSAKYPENELPRLAMNEKKVKDDKNETSTENPEDIRNISLPSSVTPEKTEVALLDKPEIGIKKAVPNTGLESSEKRIVDEAVSFNEPDKNDSPANSYASLDNNNRVEILNTSVSNKNRMRGLFRKISRVVEKATAIGSEENENKKGLRIANFEIALK